MKSMRFVLPILLPMLGACAWWVAGRRVVENRLIFSHQLHFENGVDCKTCHAGVDESANLQASLVPPEATCMDCHSRDNCGMCHTNPAGPTAPRGHQADIGFAHKDHLPRVNGDCAKCHPDATTTTAQPASPPMDTCLSCHEHQQDYAAARCLGCHPTLQHVPLRAVAELDHGGDWLGRHALMAKADGASCNACHLESMCVSCHSKVAPAAPARLSPERVERSLLHRGDFATTHGMEARLDGETCLRCHAVNTCDSCHQSRGVGAGAAGGRNPHPVGWMTPGSDRFHGTDARQNIVSCAACHDQGKASNCVECHAQGRVGGSPHPPGWKGEHEDAHEEPVCRTCHSADIDDHLH